MKRMIALLAALSTLAGMVAIQGCGDSAPKDNSNVKVPPAPPPPGGPTSK